MKRIVTLAAVAAALFAALPSTAQQQAAPAGRAGAGRGAAAAQPAAATGPARFESTIEGYRTADRANFPEPCQLLLVGSSSIIRWTTSAADLEPMKSLNRGFGGSTAPDLNYYFRDVVAPYRPRQIVWYEGDNDLNAGRTPAQVFAEFEKFIALKDRALGETPVYAIGVKPSLLRESQNAVQTEFNNMLKAYAERRRDVVYIDVWPPLMANGHPKPVFVADGLHLNPEGYRLWTSAVKPVLQQRPPTRAPGC